MRKMLRQPAISISHLPSNGPTAPAIAPSAAQVPIAGPRSSPVEAGEHEGPHDRANESGKGGSTEPAEVNPAFRANVITAVATQKVLWSLFVPKAAASEAPTANSPGKASSPPPPAMA